MAFTRPGFVPGAFPFALIAREAFAFRAGDEDFGPFADRAAVFFALDFCFFIETVSFRCFYRNPAHEYSIC
jgi:hypothetical protein